MWAVHIMRFSVVYRKFWTVRIAYLRNIGVDVVLVPSKEAAVARVKAEKTQYLEALKYIHK